MQGTGTNTHTATLNPGTYSGASGNEYENGIGKTTLTAICNDDNGFSIYAIGYTGNSYDSADHTKLVGNSLGGTIATKAYASGDTASNWSMKLTKVTNTSQSYNPQNLTLTTGYDSWHAVPDTYTKVAQYKANTGSSITDTSLCPAGWHLPTGGLAYASGNTGGVNVTGDPTTFREFYNLGYTIMGSNLTAYESNANSGFSYYGTNTANPAGDTATKAFRKYPNNFIYSGYFTGSLATVQGGFGGYWSSTANFSQSANYLNLGSNIRPGTDYSNKSYGYVIRCISSS